MKPSSDTQVFIPLALAADIEAAADTEHRPPAEIVREALERYLADWRKGAGLAQARPGPARRTPAEAAARLRELRKGNILPDGVTIQDLMTHGRA